MSDSLSGKGMSKYVFPNELRIERYDILSLSAEGAEGAGAGTIGGVTVTSATTPTVARSPSFLLSQRSSYIER